jgi:hypothetical protein
MALLLVLSVTAFPTVALATPAPSTATVQAVPALPPAPRQGLTVVTMRLGISAGDVIQNVERGADRRALERIVPELFQEAIALGVRIDSVSVGRGFWSEDGEVESENDLDLVVTGLRENVLALGALMGDRWGQSAVLAWEMRVTGEMLTATMPLIGGTAALDEPVFDALARALTDGGHIRYAGPESLVFAAHTGDDSDEQFMARMDQAKTALERAGVWTGPLSFGHAEMVALTRANYQQFIDAAVRGKAA